MGPKQASKSNIFDKPPGSAPYCRSACGDGDQAKATYSVRDNDIQSPKAIRRLSDDALAVLQYTYILSKLVSQGCKESKQSPTHAFDNERLDLVFFLHFPGHLVRSLLIRIVIDGDIAAFSSEFLGYKSTQTSAFVAMSTMVCRADGCNDPTDLEPPVIRALRPLRLYGIVWNRGASRSRAWRHLIRWH